jgi:hypothetical protein
VRRAHVLRHRAIVSAEPVDAGEPRRQLVVSRFEERPHG